MTTPEVQSLREAMQAMMIAMARVEEQLKQVRETQADAERQRKTARAESALTLGTMDSRLGEHQKKRDAEIADIRVRMEAIAGDMLSKKVIVGVIGVAASLSPVASFLLEHVR